MFLEAVMKTRYAEIGKLCELVYIYVPPIVLIYVFNGVLNAFVDMNYIVIFKREKARGSLRTHGLFTSVGRTDRMLNIITNDFCL